MTGKVTNSTCHALNGAIASADSAPAASAMPARFHPHDRMIARPSVRSLSAGFTAGRPRRGLAAAALALRARRRAFLAGGDAQALDASGVGVEHLDFELAGA